MTRRDLQITQRLKLTSHADSLMDGTGKLEISKSPMRMSLLRKEKWKWKEGCDEVHAGAGYRWGVACEVSSNVEGNNEMPTLINKAERSLLFNEGFLMLLGILLITCNSITYLKVFPRLISQLGFPNLTSRAISAWQKSTTIISSAPTYHL